uniref:Uncharacterized protein n=1 Tax=Anguilla anguilla TaxID=7936 RepID=A0A0E9WER3_ANGAN
MQYFVKVRHRWFCKQKQNFFKCTKHSYIERPLLKMKLGNVTCMLPKEK